MYRPDVRLSAMVDKIWLSLLPSTWPSGSPGCPRKHYPNMQGLLTKPVICLALFSVINDVTYGGYSFWYWSWVSLYDYWSFHSSTWLSHSNGCSVSDSFDIIWLLCLKYEICNLKGLLMLEAVYVPCVRITKKFLCWRLHLQTHPRSTSDPYLAITLSSMYNLYLIPSAITNI